MAELTPFELGGHLTEIEVIVAWTETDTRRSAFEIQTAVWFVWLNRLNMVNSDSWWMMVNNGDLIMVNHGE